MYLEVMVQMRVCHLQQEPRGQGNGGTAAFPQSVLLFLGLFSFPERKIW